jgi:hypothetical protein
MQYYAIFDTNGNRVTTYVEGIHENIPSEALEITEEEQKLYCTGEYIRDWVSGKPILKLPYVPTKEEIKTQKLTQLNTEYQPQFAELSKSLGMATLADNTALIASIKADYVDLKTEYDIKRGEIDG